MLQGAESVDGTDLEILQLLVKDPQEPFSRIATKVGVSPRTVQKKVQKMKKERILLGSSIIIDLSKLGYQGEASIQITNVPGYDKATTINALKRIPNIFLITEITGDFDIMAIAAVKDYPSVINMVNAIRQLPSVEKAEVDFVTDTQFPATTKFNDQLTQEKR
jgi:Lrp/AsnC family transcriptional regulator for asnA, asnC and gidA